MIAIINYSAGNVKSVLNALEALGYEAKVTDDVSEIKAATKVIFPGVGEAKSAMKSLKEKGLDSVIPNLKQPFLGICLGLQLLCKYSEEGSTTCLGVYECNVKRFPTNGIIPHMGWNNIEIIKSQIIDQEIKSQDFYFVHSYYASICASTSATCEYILPFSAVLEKDNFYATQFHPEKSGDIGFKVLQNFLEL